MGGDFRGGLRFRSYKQSLFRYKSSESATDSGKVN